jgi:hypothetical protein
VPPSPEAEGFIVEFPDKLALDEMTKGLSQISKFIHHIASLKPDVNAPNTDVVSLERGT